MEFLSRIFSIVERYRFVSLLVSLLLFMILRPMIEAVSESRGLAVAEERIVFGAVLVAAAISAEQSRVRMIAGFTLVTLVIGLYLGWRFYPSTALEVLNYLVSVGFLLYVIASLLRSIFATRRVRMDTICASLCVYLLLAVTWMVLYSLCAALQTAPFAASDGNPPGMRLLQDGPGTALYFSVVTLATLGYGDIVPTSGVTRMLAGLEAIGGQVYLAVLVARLVGMHISDGRDGDPPASSDKPS